MTGTLKERAVIGDILVPASLEEVWHAWTTEDGARAFFAPECHIDLRPGGAYEMLFDLEAPPGYRGGEGLRVLALQAMAMLSFTWNAPPELPGVRHQHTHVVVRMASAGPHATRLRLWHDGWGEGGEWDEAFAYFQRAWLRVVLPRLQYRFEVGPVDWAHLPDLGR